MTDTPPPKDRTLSGGPGLEIGENHTGLETGSTRTDAARPGTWPKAVPLLVLAGLLAYANCYAKVFLFDDSPHIVLNQNTNDFGRYVFGMGRPLVALTLWLNLKLGGLNPAGFHAVNVAVHILAGLTLYGLVRRTLLVPRFAGRYDATAPYLAFAVALLWLVHPLQTQAVTYIIQRCESMMGLFYLFTFYAWHRATAGNRWWYAAAVGSFFCSTQCKEVAATLPVLLVAYDRIFLAGSWRELVRRRWPAYLALFVVWGFYLWPTLTTAFGGGTGVGVGIGIAFSTPYTYLLTESEVILHYLRLAAVPVNQSFDYLGWPIAQSIREVWPAFAAVALMFAASLVLLWFRPPVGFLGLWFFVILAPTSSVMPIIDVCFEHRMYLPLAAVIAAGVFGFDALLRRYSPAGWPEGRRTGLLLGTTAAVAAFLTLLTIARNEVYRSTRAMWEDAARKQPNNVRPITVLVAEYVAARELDLAYQELERGQAISTPANVYIARSRALWYYTDGQFDQAEALYSRLVQLPFDTTSPGSYRALGWLLLAKGQPAEAARVFRTLVENQPRSALQQMYLAAAELAAGREAEARAAADEAVRLDPTIVKAVATEARTSAIAPDPVTARRDIPKAIWLASAATLAAQDKDPFALDALAMAYAAAGRYADGAFAAVLSPLAQTPANPNYAKAADAARRGVAAAEAAGEPDWAATLRARLRFYEAGRPYGKGG